MIFGDISIRYKSILIIFIFTTFLCSSAWSQNADKSSNEKPKTPFLRGFIENGVPVSLQADYIDFDSEKEIYNAQGHVLITQKDSKMSADVISIDMKTRRISAVGNVFLENDEGRLTCEAADMEFEDVLGVVIQGKLVVYKDDFTYYFSGERIEKIGEDRYVITKGTYTSCNCADDELVDWIIEAEEIDLTVDGYAVVHRGRYVAFGHPIIWIPYGVFPAKVTRQTGLLAPEIGWANDDGYRLGIPFYWAIDPSNDLTVYTDWFQNRGLKEGLEYRYALSQRWKGQFDLDVLFYDQLYKAERWAFSYEHQQNIWRRLYLRAKINLVSDTDYVVDFSEDISARYNTFLRSNIILNNLWEHFDLNLNVEHYRDLTTEDNSHTWQKVPELQFNGVMRPIVGPLSYRFDVKATQFERERIKDEETLLDQVEGHEDPYYFLTHGTRLELTPELLAPLSFKRYAYLTPFVGGLGQFYLLDERKEDQTPTRFLYFAGADLHTEIERVFPIYLPTVRGVKHSIQPGLSYIYYPDSTPEDQLPVFDGRDRHNTKNAITYYFDNRLWMKVFNLRKRNFQTLKFLELRLSQDYDIYEAGRKLDPDIGNDELRPFSPVRARLETIVTPDAWLNKILFLSNAYYNIYDNRIGKFDALGLLGANKDDALGVEYRYHIIENSDFIDINYLSGLARYTLLEILTFGVTIRYSFIDDYFVERIYSAKYNSAQDCWSLEFRLEQRKLPEYETVVRLFLDLTGLINTGTTF